MTDQFRITRMYHPSFHAPDLGEVEAWFARVFGCQSTNIYETFKGRETGSYPTNYSTFTPMADVLMDTIQPTLYVLNGVQQYASVDKPHLKTIGWFAEDSEGVYRSLLGAPADTAGLVYWVRQLRAGAPRAPAGAAMITISSSQPRSRGCSATWQEPKQSFSSSGTSEIATC